MSDRPNLLVTWPDDWVRKAIFPEEQIRRLERIAKVRWNPHKRQYKPEELCDALVGMDVVFTGWGTPQLDETVLAKADKLRLVAHCAGSVGSHASDALYDRGIIITTSNDVMARQVAEFCGMLMLMGLRKVRHFMEPMYEPDESYEWPKEAVSHLTCPPVYETLVGIIGLGAIAKWFIKFIQPMEPKILLYSRHTKPAEAARLGVELVDLDDLLVRGDVINVLCGLTEETYHLLDAERLAKIKDGAVLINVGRGAIIDEDALIAELQKGRFYAALDVYEIEPLPAESPLRKLRNAILAPHYAGRGNMKDYSRFCIDELERFLKGEPLQGTVSREQWKHMTRSDLVAKIAEQRRAERKA